MERPNTPPPNTQSNSSKRSPITPEIAHRIEESRLRAKAIRQQRDAEFRAQGKLSSVPTTSSGLIETDTITLTNREADIARANAFQSRPPKRPLEASAPSAQPTDNRDGRLTAAAVDGALRPSKRLAKRLAKYVDYNLSNMTDTKGGFLSAEDDPTGEAARFKRIEEARNGGKPKHMSDKEWERLQLIRNLERHKVGPFEPGVSMLDDEQDVKKCRDCGGRDIDWMWQETFGCCVCGACKEKFPEKYSLLTKTEAREDYLLTEPELKDTDLLPHLSKPNPHKSHWHDMMLFLRYQVEEYALGPQKWGSVEALDAEFEKREADKKRRKEAKFKEKLLDLKRKTRTEAYRRQAAAGKAGASNTGGKFGDTVGGTGRHTHTWGRSVENAQGATLKKCVDCGMEVEELEF